MNRDLFFIPMIAKAFEEADPVEALEHAFAEIESMGNQEQHGDGLAQFDRLMEEAQPVFRLEILVEHKGSLLTRIPASSVTAEVRIQGIAPGDYEIRLSTGRVLWTGHLGPEDLIWASAFPDSPLRMAADTGTEPMTFSRELRLCNAEIVARVYPGLENGTIGVRVGSIAQ